jgi:hypothetical protein
MSKQDEARPLLWPDERIKDLTYEKHRTDFQINLAEAGYRVSRIMRDEYEARIAELEQRLAEVTESLRVIVSAADRYYRGFNAGYDVAQAQQEQHIADLERRLAETSEWQPVEMGEKVMCNCDDPQCYHCIEAVADSLIVYEDVSDERERTITVELPDGWAFCRRTVAGEASIAEGMSDGS